MEIVLVTRDSPSQFFKAIAAIHDTELRPGVLADLGPSFLTFFYRVIARDDDCALFAALEDGEVLGFVAGTMDTRRYYRRLALGHVLRVSLYLVPYILRPSVIGKIVVRIRNLGSRAMTDLPRAELLSIALRPSSQAKGAGRKLYAALRDDFRRRGVEHFKVSTAEGRVAAQKFYEGFGCRLTARVSQGELTALTFVCPTTHAEAHDESS